MLLKYFVAGAALLGLAACVAPDVRPRGVSITLSSGTITKAYTDRELANPTVQKIIEECKRLFGPIKKCDGQSVPADDRTEFDRTVHNKVWTQVALDGLQAGRVYDVNWLLFDPDGNRRSYITAPIRVPSEWKINYDLKYTFEWTPPDQSRWQLGRWKIEILVNGKPELERFFTVVEDK